MEANQRRIHRVVINGLLVLGVALTSLTLATNANAVDSTSRNASNSPLAAANPRISPDVIAALPAVLLDRSDLIIDPSITATTPLIYTDGTVVPGQNYTTATAASSCGSAMAAPGAPGVWSDAYSSGCGLIGIDANAKAYYSIYTHPASSGSAQWQVYGFSNGVGKWFAGGAGTSSNVTIPWGNVMAVPKAKAAATILLVGWMGGFYH